MAWAQWGTKVQSADRPGGRKVSKKARARRAEIAAALENFDRLPDSSHVRVPVVAALFGCGRSTIWQWTKDRRLPAPKKLGPRTSTIR
jgi:hypothetical protein